MKKWLSLLLAVIMAFGLSACAGKSENNQAAGSGTEASQEDTENQETAESKQPRYLLPRL